MFGGRDCTCSVGIPLHFLPGEHGIYADSIFPVPCTAVEES